MVHELIDTPSNPGLAEIVEAWSALPEHVKDMDLEGLNLTQLLRLASL
jgi:hypothetical protein